MCDKSKTYPRKMHANACIRGSTTRKYMHYQNIACVCTQSPHIFYFRMRLRHSVCFSSRTHVTFSSFALLCFLRSNLGDRALSSIRKQNVHGRHLKRGRRPRRVCKAAPLPKGRRLARQSPSNQKRRKEQPQAGRLQPRNRYVMSFGVIGMCA